MTISHTKRKRILNKYNYTCQHCGFNTKNTAGYSILKEGKWLEIDHIFPKFLGGKNDEDNLTVLCNVCNSKKGVRIAI